MLVKGYDKGGSCALSFECHKLHAYKPIKLGDMEYSVLWFVDGDDEVVARVFVDTFHHPEPLVGYASTISRSIEVLLESDKHKVQTVGALRVIDEDKSWSY